MTTPQTPSWRRQIQPQALSRFKQLDAARRHPGHTHFWDRAVSRRQFVQVTAAAAGLILASPWTASAVAVPANTPKPIPGGFQFPGIDEVFHNFAPGVFDPLDTDRSGIFDFKGRIGYAIIDGTGSARTKKGAATPLSFEVDVRFMQGTYVAEDGRHRHATFCLT